MRSSEGQPQEGQRFGMPSADRVRGGSTITAPKPPVRTQHDPTIEEAKAANQGEYSGETRAVEKVGGNKVLKAVLGGGIAVAGGAIAYEAIPAVHRAVDSAFLDHIKGKSLSTEASINPEVFDNSTPKGVGPNNILYVPWEVFDKLPIVDEKGNPIFDFPWDPNHQINRGYKAGLSNSWASWSTKGEANINTSSKNEWKESTNLPEGYEFPSIYPGSRVFFMANPYDKNVIEMAKIEFITPNGTFHFVNIQIVENKGGQIIPLPITPLINVALISPENRNGKDIEKGTLVENRLQNIFRSTKAGKLYMYTEAWKNGSLLFKDQGPGNFNFQTGVDATGTQKFLISNSK